MFYYKKCRLRKSLSLLVMVQFSLTPVAAKEGKRLDEITVTARKQETSLQDASVAISVLSGEDFARANIRQLDDFNGYIPGLTISKNDGAGRVVAIRGVGWETAQNLSTQPSVLVYMDGVYVANPLSIGSDIGDIERIEVFRGPQGTEFGQGATGGAINLVIKKPSIDAVSGQFSLGFGNYDTVKAASAVNLPLSDTLAVRASIQKYKRDGFAEIEGGSLDGYQLDDADSLTAKLSMLWQPTEQFSAYLSWFHSDSDNHAAAQKNVNDPIRDARRLSQDFPGIFSLENSLLSAKLQWQLDNGITLSWLSGYQDLKKRQSVDGDRLNERLTSINLQGFSFANWDVLTFWDNDSTAFTQEFNAVFSNDQFDWVVGAYYLDHENFNHFLEATGPAPFSDSIAALANPSAQTLPPFQSVLNFVEARTVTRKDSAVYGQTTYRFSDKLELTGGVRYQKEKQNDDSLQFFSFASSLDTNDDALTWKLGLNYYFSDDNLLYGLISTGWKNGGTNPGANNGAQQVSLSFLAAEVTSFEIGSKNTLADGRGRLNLTAFFNKYDNLQFMQEDPTPFAGGTGNIPKTEIYGVEAEFDWLLSDSWRLNGHITWADGKMTEDFYTLDVVDFREGLAPFQIGLFTPGGAEFRSQLGATTNLRGNTPPKLVDLMARIGLTNTHVFANNSQLVSQISYIYRGEYQYRVFNNPLVDTVPSYSIVNMAFNYQMANSQFDYALNISNLFDKDGVNSRFSNPFGLLTTSDEYIPPRQIIATMSYTF